MIDYVRGTLINAAFGKVVVEIGGLGLAVDMPPAETKLPGMVGQEIALYTRLLVKDDEMIIYGFQTAEERKLFNLILGVSGFGPRLALSLLGILTVSQLYIAVLEENYSQLSRAHGVGRKAAQRLVLELKEKLPKALSAAELSGDLVTGGSVSLLDEVVEALVALGYTPAEAAAAANRAYEHDKAASREDLLKRALKGMGQG